jgi:hypothetical protein
MYVSRTAPLTSPPNSSSYPLLHLLPTPPYPFPLMYVSRTVPLIPPPLLFLYFPQHFSLPLLNTSTPFFLTTPSSSPINVRHPNNNPLLMYIIRTLNVHLPLRDLPFASCAARTAWASTVGGNFFLKESSLLMYVIRTIAPINVRHPNIRTFSHAQAP